MDHGTGLCNRCGAEDSPYIYGPLMHGGTYECKRCRVEEQVNYLREQLPKLAELEDKLALLGGPIEREVCGYISWYRDGDTSKFGDFCWLDKDHEGFHDTTNPNQ